MKTILNEPSIKLFSHSYCPFSSALILVLALFLWSCTKESDELAPLRESDKTVFNTRPPAFVATDSVKLSAEILETGPAPILEAGFILSQAPEPSLEKGTRFKLSGVKEPGPYSFVVRELEANKKYYYRFYLQQKDQVLLGSTQVFTTNGVVISRVSYINTGEPTDFYEGGAGNKMMVQGTNFSTIPSENVLKVGNTTIAVTSTHAYNDMEESMALYFTLPDNISPGLHEVTVTRAGQTVKAPEALQVLPGKWKQLQDLKTGLESNGPSYNADAFSMNGKGYIAGMLPYLPISLYQYTPGADSWGKLNLSIKTYHSFHTAFGLNGKVYVSTGIQNYNALPGQTRYGIQLHSLDPATGVQEQRQSMPAFYPYNAANATLTAFTIGDHAFLGGGEYATLNSWGHREYNSRTDFYRYTPASDTWTAIADFPGSSTTGAVTFEVNGIAYLVAPSHNYKILPEVWAYNPATNTWSRKRDFPGQLKYGMAGFSVGSNGYVVGGSLSSYMYAPPGNRDFWQYNPATDTWQEVATFDGSTKSIKCFVVNGKAYAIHHQSQTKSSVWEFTPAQ